MSSKSSNKSNREIELETQVQQLTQMVHQQNQTLTQQATTINNLKNSMQAFISHFQYFDQQHSTKTTPHERKRKDGPAQSVHSLRRPSHGINNTGEDTEMATPPDPQLEPHDINVSFDSAQMSFFDSPCDDEELQHCNATLNTKALGKNGISHATRSKSDMKKQC